MISVIITAAVILVLVGADQALKFWAIASLQGQPERPFLQLGSLDWMHLRYIENSGAAFSSLSGNRGFLIIFPVIMITACFYVLNRLGKTRRWVWFSLPLIAAGGIGNLIDRIFRGGKVVDYLDFQLCRFAVFNFADICVTVGVLILMFSIIFLEKEEKNAKKAKKAVRIPFARTAAALPEADILPEAAALPEADVLPEAETRPEAEAAAVLNNEDHGHAGA